MTEPINKILATTSQAFTTAQQAQARANIGAQKSIAYSYDGTRITAIDNSAVGLNAVSANNCISGDGSSGSPLGLSATAQWTAGANWYPMTEISAGHLKISAQELAGAQIYQNESSLCNWTPTGITVHHTASGVGGGSIDNFYGEILNLNYNAGQYYLHHISSDASGLRAKHNGNPNNASIFGFGSAAFSDNNETSWEVVDPSSIRRWNGYSASGWAESSNPLSVGYGGNQVSAASQYNVGQGNWAARTVKASGIPDMDLYGFRNLPVGQGPFGVNGNGAWIDLKPETRWESSFQVTSKTYDLLNIPKNATAFINVQGHFGNCSYVNMTTSKGSWLSETGGGTTAGGGFRTWPLTNITTLAKGGTAENGYTPQLQVVTTGNTTVRFTVNMVIKEA